MAGKVEGIAAKTDKLSKMVANLEAWLKKSESRLEEAELRIAKEREASKELEEELIMHKKEVVAAVDEDTKTELAEVVGTPTLVVGVTS